MIIERIKNPEIKDVNENIVKITMTLDQFHMLKDCITLAYSKAEKTSRMFLIANLIHTDIEVLKQQLSQSYNTNILYK